MTMRGDPIWWAAMACDAVGFAIAATTGIIVWLRKRSSRHWPVTFGNVESAWTSKITPHGGRTSPTLTASYVADHIGSCESPDYVN